MHTDDRIPLLIGYLVASGQLACVACIVDHYVNRPTAIIERFEETRDLLGFTDVGRDIERFDPSRLQAYYAARGISAELDTLPDSGDAAPLLLHAVEKAGAQILVAGAFGHPRLQEFIFGGTTRTLLGADQPSLFLSH